MAKKKFSASSKGKPSKNLKQKKGKKGGKATSQNFRRKKAKDKETDEFDEVLPIATTFKFEASKSSYSSFKHKYMELIITGVGCRVDSKARADKSDCIRRDVTPRHAICNG